MDATATRRKRLTPIERAAVAHLQNASDVLDVPAPPLAWVSSDDYCPEPRVRIEETSGDLSCYHCRNRKLPRYYVLNGLCEECRLFEVWRREKAWDRELNGDDEHSARV